MDQPLRLTAQQRGIISKIKGRITTTIEENNTVKITAEMPDPLVATRATEIATGLPDAVHSGVPHRQSPAGPDLCAAAVRREKERYGDIQRRLARFRDQNMNIISETARIRQEQLESENELAFSLYQGLAQQLEQAKIKVQEETPVFKVLEPIQVPLSPVVPTGS